MGFLKPNIETRQPTSQATPLSQDVLSILRQAISGGNMSDTALTPEQKAASEGVSSFIASRQSPEMFNQLMGPLREAFGLQTEKDVAATRSGFSATGNRFSRSMMREEGRVRNEANTNLNAQLSKMFLDEQTNLLGALQLQQGMGMQNLQPFLDFAGLGVLPQQTFVTDNPWMTLLSGVIQGAGQAVGAKKG